jgi:hypothetical protein
MKYLFFERINTMVLLVKNQPIIFNRLIHDQEVLALWFTDQFLHRSMKHVLS